MKLPSTRTTAPFVIALAFALPGSADMHVDAGGEISHEVVKLDRSQLSAVWRYGDRGYQFPEFHFQRIARAGLWMAPPARLCRGRATGSFGLPGGISAAFVRRRRDRALFFLLKETGPAVKY
jgi:hypothetical protein